MSACMKNQQDVNIFLRPNVPGPETDVIEKKRKFKKMNLSDPEGQ